MKRIEAQITEARADFEEARGRYNTRVGAGSELLRLETVSKMSHVGELVNLSRAYRAENTARILAGLSGAAIAVAGYLASVHVYGWW